MTEATQVRTPEAVIVIGTPSTGTSVDNFSETLFRMQFGGRSRYHLIPVRCEGSAIAHNQNNIVKAARNVTNEMRDNAFQALLKKGMSPEEASEHVKDVGVDAIFFIENDESFRNAEDVIDRLWKHGKDIVGCTYAYKFHDRVRAMGVELDGSPLDWLSLYAREPLTQVAALPIGALMVKMKVFDAMDERENAVIGHDGQPSTIKGGPIFYHDVHHKLKLVRTTDYVFCSNARDLGFEVWLDAPQSLEIEHWGKHPYCFPHPAKIGRHIATLQAVADAHAKAADEEGSPPHYQQMAQDLYEIAADLVRRSGAFAYDPARHDEPRVELPDEAA